MNHSQKFAEQDFDKLLNGFKGETLRDKGKSLMNCKLFVKFVKVFHHRTFALYSSYN